LPRTDHEFVRRHFCLHLIDNIAALAATLSVANRVALMLMCVPDLDGREVPAEIKGDLARVP
jgi:hypothetical protein